MRWLAGIAVAAAWPAGAAHAQDAGEVPRPGAIFRDCAECPEMAAIPAGTLSWRPYDGANAAPPPVAIEVDAFAAGRKEVTWDEWEACVADGGCDGLEPEDRGWGRGARPVIYVSWRNAQAYVRWLSEKTGETYRLLTEAEWEHAARAGATGVYPWGDEPPVCAPDAPNGANFAPCDDDRSHPAGAYPPNAFGLHDMAGNVWEWVADCYRGDTTAPPADGSAGEREDCRLRILRGGAWVSGHRSLRPDVRIQFPPELRNYTIGFRVARDL